MPFIVYAPFSGGVSQKNLATHYPCTDGAGGGTLSVIDIGASAGTYINLSVSYPDIKSILIATATSDPFECCDGLPSEPEYLNLKRALRVNLYAQLNREDYIGWVLFGHVNTDTLWLPNMGANGNLSEAWVGRLGSVASGSDPDCYNGAHSHMESNTGYDSNLGWSVVAGSTPIYRW